MKLNADDALIECPQTIATVEDRLKFLWDSRPKHRFVYHSFIL